MTSVAYTAVSSRRLLCGGWLRAGVESHPDLVSVFSLAFGKWRLRVKVRKRRKLAGKSFLGQNHYAVPCCLLVANPLFKIISLAVTRTVKSGHSLRLSSFSLEAGISFFS